MEIQVEKEDIQIIGHTAYEEDGNTTFICDSKYDGFSYLFLKNILKCFGAYEIIDSYELFTDEQDTLSVTDRVFKTNSFRQQSRLFLIFRQLRFFLLCISKL